MRGFYPKHTRFVVLPVDFEHMGSGRCPHSLDHQHTELLALALSPEVTGLLIPFCAVDPRRQDILNDVRRWHQAGFRGIKLYPGLGFDPSLRNSTMDAIYAYAAEHDLSIMTHCSPGGVIQRGATRATVHAYNHPLNYEAVLTKYPKLRICLAHFGGTEEWKRYLRDPWFPTNERSWLSIIADMIKVHPNLFTDISFTLFHYQENMPTLKVFLSDQRIRERVLFGSDYYMVELHNATEREVSIRLRAELGEALFRQIAETNPRAYLGF